MKRKLESIGKQNKLDEEEYRLSKLLFTDAANIANSLDNEIKKENKLSDREAVWHDDDDDLFSANEILNTRSIATYASTLKNKYTTLIGTPKWARFNTAKTEDSGNEDNLMRTVGHIEKRKSDCLRKGILAIKRLPQINEETRNEGPLLTSLEFHPKASVALVGGFSGIVSIFSVGGRNNNKLHSVAFRNFPILKTQFTPDGSEVLLTSRRSRNFELYDLMKADSTTIPFPRSVKRPTSFEISHCGKYLIIVDGYEDIHLMCAKSKELIKTLKQSSKVESVIFSSDSKKIYGYSIDGSISVHNISALQIEHKFVDDGCVTGSTLAGSPCGQFLAAGSSEGVVNLYKTNDLTKIDPKPLKTVFNISTKITSLKFNSSSEILALSSSYYPNSVRLLHIPSLNVFSNFPDSQSRFFQISSLNFSPNSGYFGLTNNKNSAFLYRIKHYKNY